MSSFCSNSILDFLQYFKYTYSTVLLIFSVILVMACIVTGQSKAALYNIHPSVAVILFWVLIGWLGVMEGGQGCLVGLRPFDKDTYKDTHSLTFRCTKIAHKGVNLERFIVGRQFLVVLVIFLINMMGEAQPGADPLNLPQLVNTIFLGNSLAMILTVIDLGQLPSQVSAATSMLDFIESYTFLMTTYVSLAIEFSGLLHSVYLVQYVFEKLAGMKTTVSRMESTPTKVFFWVRCAMSTGIVFFSLAVTIQALIEGKSGMWNGVPIWASIIIFFVLLCVVGLMEGMQIAAFALLNMPEEELRKYSMAHKSCTLMFKGENLQAFLIGRQIFVAALMFIVARIATISIPEGETNIFNVSDGFQSFLDTGLLGAIILTVIGSLIWRVIASSLPLLFMSNPILYVIIRAAFLLEAIGICAVSWLLSIGIKRIFHHKTDDVYVGKSVRMSQHCIPDLETSCMPDAYSDDDSDDDFAGEKKNDLTPLAQKSMREILLPEGEDLNEAVHSMKAALVKSARMSAVMSTRDIDKLMADLVPTEKGHHHDDNDSDYSDDDDDDLQGHKKVETSMAKKSLRDFSAFLTTKEIDDNDNEEEDVGGGETPLMQKSMRDIIGAIFQHDHDDENNDSSNDDDDDNNDVKKQKEEEELKAIRQKKLDEMNDAVLQSQNVLVEIEKDIFVDSPPTTTKTTTAEEEEEESPMNTTVSTMNDDSDECEEDSKRNEPPPGTSELRNVEESMDRQLENTMADIRAADGGGADSSNKNNTSIV